MVKNPPTMRETWVGKNWQPTLVVLPGESPWTEEPDGLHTVHRVAKSRIRLSD